MSTTPNTYLRSLTILHGAMLIGQILFTAVSAYRVYDEGISETGDLVSAFQAFVPAILVAGIALGTIIYKNKTRALKEETDLDKKLTDYRSISVVRWALMEGPALFAIIAYMITGSMPLLVIALVAIVVFVIIRPTKRMIVRDLGLNPDEEASLL